MKRLLRAMLFALLPLIAMFVILVVMYGIACIFEALGVNEGTSILLSVIALAYLYGVVVYYK